ncbi:DUF1902 domain-containing protein [Paracoccus aeridis]|uniref:DUF1902 domain-containing protein n=1 Tax=Paracoccus aeridis TaxID=1966466 RepID=UPI0010AA69B2|nr:DUF1902 domain-containing protein [Paracoccus aeridis]
MRLSIVVDVQYDPDAEVWVGTSNDVRGLVVEGEDLDALAKNVLSAVPALIELNGLPKRRFAWLASLLGRRFDSSRVELDIRQHAVLSAHGSLC